LLLKSKSEQFLQIETEAIVVGNFIKELLYKFYMNLDHFECICKNPKAQMDFADFAFVQN
jgi:hypothetical protein